MPNATELDLDAWSAKRFSEAAERNKAPILATLEPLLRKTNTVLEIGSGTGQHAVYICATLPHLTWYTSDLPDNHSSINAWIADGKLDNVRPPVTLNIDDAPWVLMDAGLPTASVDIIYTSNTLHIINWEQVIQLFSGMGDYLNQGGHLCIYGPFKNGGQFTSEGDASFDAHLKSQGTGSGIRDYEAVNKLAEKEGLNLVEKNLMPANNYLMVWQKR